MNNELNRNNARRKILRRKPKGYLYLSIMGVAMIVSIVGFSAMSLARKQLRDVQDNNDYFEARLLSLSAVEHGIADINNTSWRTGYTNDTEYPSPAEPLGNGSFTVKLVDETDGNLSNNSTDDARLYGIGRVGRAVYVQSVLLTPDGSGSDMKITPGSWQRNLAP